MTKTAHFSFKLCGFQIRFIFIPANFFPNLPTRLSQDQTQLIFLLLLYLLEMKTSQASWLFLHRRTSLRSVSSKRVCSRTTTLRTPPCSTVRRSRAAAGILASTVMVRSWRATGWRRTRELHTFCLKLSKVWLPDATWVISALFLICCTNSSCLLSHSCDV